MTSSYAPTDRVRMHGSEAGHCISTARTKAKEYGASSVLQIIHVVMSGDASNVRDIPARSGHKDLYLYGQ